MRKPPFTYADLRRIFDPETASPRHDHPGRKAAPVIVRKSVALQKRK